MLHCLCLILGLPGDKIPTDVFNNVALDEWSHRNGNIPPGRMWVEGDNDWVPEKFKDSRTYGPVPIGLLEGIVFCRLWPNFTTKRTWINDLNPSDG